MTREDAIKQAVRQSVHLDAEHYLSHNDRDNCVRCIAFLKSVRKIFRQIEAKNVLRR